MNDLFLADSHLDLAENLTLFGRDLTLRASEIRTLEKRTRRQATVSLPELERGGIAVAFATVTAGFLGRGLYIAANLVMAPSQLIKVSELAKVSATRNLRRADPSLTLTRTQHAAIVSNRGNKETRS